MPGRIARHPGRLRGQQGFTLLEVLVAMLMLTATAVMLTQGYMVALSRVDETGDHSVGASWVQATIDYLRNQGYSVSGAWTETSSSCTDPEPCLPAGFSQATIAVTNTATPGLKQIDITLFRQGIASPFLAATTYAADLVFP